MEEDCNKGEDAKGAHLEDKSCNKDSTSYLELIDVRKRILLEEESRSSTLSQEADDIYDDEDLRDYGVGDEGRLGSNVRHPRNQIRLATWIQC